MSKRSAREWLDAYGESHQDGLNKIIHWICVPAIMFSLMGLLVCIPSGFLAAALPASLAPWGNWATLFILASLVFYLRLSLPLAIGFIPIGVALLWGNVALKLAEAGGSPPLVYISLAIFVLAWLGQFIGHKIEGEKPSFFEDLQFLLIGPAWLLAAAYHKLGIRY